MKKTAFLLVALLLAGCTFMEPLTAGTAASNAATVFLTRTREPPPADTSYNIPPHESWCYRTMATTECYATPQDVPPSRLVNVDPQYYYPNTPDAYRARLAGVRPETPSKPDNGGGLFAWLGI